MANLQLSIGSDIVRRLEPTRAVPKTRRRRAYSIHCLRKIVFFKTVNSTSITNRLEPLPTVVRTVFQTHINTPFSET